MSSSYHPFSSVVTVTRVMSFEEARHLVEQHAASVCPGEVETVDLLAGLGRVLGEEILADRGSGRGVPITESCFVIFVAAVAFWVSNVR